MNRRRTLWLTLSFLLVAGPLSAYTIYLKDGSRLIAKEKYRLEDGRALIVLQNGTQTFIAASEIDIPRTEKANQGRHGTAFVIEEGQLREAPISPTEKKQTLAGAVAQQEGVVATRPRATRPSAVGFEGTEFPRTHSGSIDLAVFPRTPYQDLEVAAESARFLHTLGVTEFQIFQGTERGRAFVEMTANSESSVFRNLEAAADTLLHLRNQYPDQIEWLEVLMLTSDRGRAGQFLLNEENSGQLAEKATDLPTFFLRNVEF